MKDYQISETEKEIQNLIDAGMRQISLSEYKQGLKTFGLKLDLNPSNYFLQYYNTSNAQPYLCATTTALDSKNISFANVNGLFYQNEVQKDSEVYKAFKAFRNKYFCVLKSNHILTI